MNFSFNRANTGRDGRERADVDLPSRSQDRIRQGGLRSCRLHRGIAPAVIGLIAGIAGALVPLTTSAQPEFNPRVVINRSFPAIENPPTMSRAEADRVLNEAELVLGVVVEGEARAYPLNMINGPQREIINDQLGGRSIAATW